MTERNDLFPVVHTEQGKKELKKLERMFLYHVLFRDSSVFENVNFRIFWIDELEAEHPEIDKLFRMKYRNADFEKSEREREKRFIRESLEAKRFNCLKCYHKQKHEYRYFDCWACD